MPPAHNASPNEIWFAARETQIVYTPPKLLETFGETNVVYNLVSPLPNGQVRLRKGLVKAARPRILTPYFYKQQMLENFGDNARDYLEKILSRKDSLRIIQYGLCFEKQEYSEQIVSGQPEEIARQIAADAQDDLAEVQGVIIGPDDYWEVSLMVFINALVQRSAPHNANEMAGQGLLNLGVGGIPHAVIQEINDDFSHADTLAKADDLARKLRDYGIFETFEDRFYELYRRLR